MSFLIKGNNAPFESYEEFIDNISRGGETVFYYKETKYTLTHGTADDGCHLIYFGVANSEDISEYKIQNDDFSIIGNLELEGKEIKDIVKEFRVLFRCF